MNIIVTASHVPFMRGGAEYHIENLTKALISAGHSVELVRFPFKFSPESFIESQMDYCENLDFNGFNGISIDRVISLQFPAYGVRHDAHRVWVMHQHRAVYDLFDSQPESKKLLSLQEKVTRYDTKVLGRAEKLFANSQNVADRLHRYNGLDAEPLYHPPPNSESFYTEDSWGYIFYPSRLETLKRQQLLIESACYLKSDAKILIAGEGGQLEVYKKLIETLGLGDRVRLIGRVSESEKRTLYARSLGVFFGPYDEDYGYISLEAMLSGKPVITCTDSGGPLEFVRDSDTGFVCAPDPHEIAEAIDKLYSNPSKARDMGQAGCEQIAAMDLNWSRVVETLLK